MSPLASSAAGYLHLLSIPRGKAESIRKRPCYSQVTYLRYKTTISPFSFSKEIREIREHLPDCSSLISTQQILLQAAQCELGSPLPLGNKPTWGKHHLPTKLALPTAGMDKKSATPILHLHHLIRALSRAQ